MVALLVLLHLWKDCLSLLRYKKVGQSHPFQVWSCGMISKALLLE